MSPLYLQLKIMAKKYGYQAALNHVRNKHGASAADGFEKKFREEPLEEQIEMGLATRKWSMDMKHNIR